MVVLVVVVVVVMVVMVVLVVGLGQRGFTAQDEATTAIHAAIPPVFDGIVATAMQTARNLGPTLAHLGDHAFDLEAFFGTDGLVVEGWLEVLVITFATLLGRAGADELGNTNPIESALSVDELA